ncbi:MULTISPECIES: hypothetical protein [unclassified Crossiella]|uniref:hypothetical protein n=1 Tax=unclassified Crossiella TaxID=2620835 RepID=UPI0020003A09|nr:MULTISPECIES: hypothetical protein [unclassified Crossiella]MCK2243815.1 hypothetical protein [Crossiella sp. S99.2]MCK2257674.1 hypothetical protein [Crossiella sp. S99.1]
MAEVVAGQGGPAGRRAAGLGWAVGVVVNLGLGVFAFFPLVFTRLLVSAIGFRLGDYSGFEARDGIDLVVLMAGLCWVVFLPVWFLANKPIVRWTAVPQRPYWLVAAGLPLVLFLADIVFGLGLVRAVF